ncbi:hypothetical protein FF80_03321 [Devosia sp. LC5]|nr:hypothetical protein FF80_03321 [Devosia sp. LC5]
MFPDFSGFIYLAYAGVFGFAVTVGLLLTGLAALAASVPAIVWVTVPIGLGVVSCVALRIWMGE